MIVCTHPRCAYPQPTMMIMISIRLAIHHDDVQDAFHPRIRSTVKDINANHRALTKRHWNAHEHHPDQREADQPFRPFSRLFEHEAAEDLKHAEACGCGWHRAGEQH